jgi:glutathione S-transferase
MKLYDNAFSPFARKIRLVLDHKGLAYEAIDALEPGAHEMLAAVNPRVEVPVLEDDGLLVVNSADIVAYLDHRYPSRLVLPADPALRVRARSLERLADTLIDAIVHDVSIWLWPTLGRTDAPPVGLREAARRDLEAIYAELDADLATREYLCGELSIAELALFPHLTAVGVLDLGFSAERHPHLLAWYRQLRGLPLFRADLERARGWLERNATRGPITNRVVWRGDRIEWLLANGFHEWFLSEIRAERVGWPVRSTRP